MGMSEQEPAEYYPIAIDLRDIRKGRINAFDVGEGTEVVVLVVQEGLTVLRDLCTHMGAPLSKGRHCRRTQTLQCPWHGYIYSLKTGEIVENPNVSVWDGLQQEYKTFKPESAPKYRLLQLRYRIEGGKLLVQKAS
jgi:nitrite reductase (NADH) small subunit/3-phenylpropionate/trans-cinnamate dioxygenase ferredoxin subunit